MRKDGNKRWDFVDSSWGKGRQRLWRKHSDAINCSLVAGWIPEGVSGSILKTDLFDEMVGEGLFSSLLKQAKQFIGVDISLATVRIACARHEGLSGIAADVRRLPFSDGKFDLIVSNSTLDHFEKHESIEESFAEIFRVLREGGQLILTMDNRMNPLVAVRNAIPSWLLKSMRLTPYYVGATWGPRGLRKHLIQAGFEVNELDAIMHCPRVLAVAAAFILERMGPRPLQKLFLQGLSSFEILKYLPTRFLTGHFVAVKAAKKRSERLEK